MLFRTANIAFGRDGVGVGLSISFIGVADALSLGVGDLSASDVAIGDGVARILGTGVGAGYLPLVSPAPLRVISHAIRTPDAPRTRTIANTHGHALLLDSPLVSPVLPRGDGF